MVCQKCLSAPAICEAAARQPDGTFSHHHHFYCGSCYSSPDLDGQVNQDRLMAVFKGTSTLLTREQVRRITFLLHAYWENDDDPDDPVDELDHFEQRFPEVLAEIQSPEELYYFALNHNWDDGVERLRLVIDHPLCDQGTALTLYWLGEPDYLLGRESEGVEVSLHEDGLNFLKYVQSKYLSCGFTSRRIQVDPSNMFDVDYLKPGPDSTGMVLIPEEMKQPSPGEPLVYIWF